MIFSFSPICYFIEMRQTHKKEPASKYETKCCIRKQFLKKQNIYFTRTN